MNLQKTKIVYCRDDRRRGNYQNTEFGFLGFTFQQRGVKSPNDDIFMGFNPAVSKKAIKLIRSEVRSWRLHLLSDKSLQDLSRMVNPILRGWVNYYGRYFRSRLYHALHPFQWILTKWAMRKYKRFKGHQRRASRWLLRIRKGSPHLFAHWQLAQMHMAGQ